MYINFPSDYIPYYHKTTTENHVTKTEFSALVDLLNHANYRLLKQEIKLTLLQHVINGKITMAESENLMCMYFESEDKESIELAKKLIDELNEK